MTPNQAKEKFDSIHTDAGRWKWLINNPESYDRVLCDNDYTFVVFGYTEDEYEDSITSDFDWPVGDDLGIFELFEAIGIEAEKV